MSNDESDDESGGSTLRTIRRVVLVSLGIVSVVGSILVGLTPDGWDFVGGFVMAFFFGYIFLREELEAYLTEPQEWAALAFVSTVAVALVPVSGEQVSDELVAAYIFGLVACGFFGYRAVLRGRRAY
ncbi:hypothetical protein AUR64_09875 [Haloprofundus marisrubri]|uniref:Uncharacterized protein n=1 Tax=Haloprofundus marisrubri TaxID=1514971 RepID=A0A0W1RBD6_9EURY|nr:hypothetical protein [Haloprofundus marisrubri]KTG09923.1 hypothetical protein AUR64_09875 [Haloprofundus marisrubri]